MRISYTTGALAATAFAFLSSTASAQAWSDNFDAYANGAAVDPGGQASIGNNWESWSSGIGSSTVAGSAPAPAANSAPNSLSNNPGADTVNNYTLQASHATSGKWIFEGHVYHPNAYQGRTYWIMLNTYSFAGPYSWSIQTYFDGTQNLVDCDCNGMNDPAGPQVLMRDVWVPIRGEVDLDLDTVDVFYNDVSLTAGAGYVWTTGVFGASAGLLEIQALDLYPDVPGNPTTTEMYYDDLELHPEVQVLGADDPACLVLANSTGFPANSVLTGTGVAGDDISAVVSSGPPGTFGYYISGPNPGLYIVPPGSSGIICIGGPQFRYNSAPLGQVFQFDAGGVSAPVAGGNPTVILPTDGSFAPVPAVVAGTSRAFQAWYRDNPMTSNFSNSTIVQF